MSGSRETRLDQSVRRGGALLTIAAFVIVVGGPLAAMMSNSGATLTSEKRKLAPLPQLPGAHRAEIEAFPERFESYFNDHFGFRSLCVRTFHRVQLQWLGASPAELSRQQASTARQQTVQHAVLETGGNVLAGKNGWLFYTGFHVLEDYRGVRPMDIQDLRAWRDVLQARHDWLAARGIRYLVIVAPNKHSIYGEHLPRALNVVSNHGQLEQFKNQLLEESTVPFLDLREALRDAKSHGRLYHQTDTHWNSLGAYYGCRAIAEQLKRWFPQIDYPSLSKFRVEWQRGLGGDLADMLALADVLNEERAVLTLKSEIRSTNALPPANGPRAVVIHDSFAGAMKPFLPHCFTSVVYHEGAFDFPESTIERERPDVVLQMFVERSLCCDPPANAPSLNGTPAVWAERPKPPLR